MKKRIAFTLAAAIAGLLIFLFIPRSSTRGIDFDGILYSFQSPLENFQYRRLINGALAGDRDALAGLVDFPCGGGAGCYDHGAVLVQILMKVGDYRFSEMAGVLGSRAKSSLDFLLAAGFEYGFPKSVDVESSKILYPLTAEAISRGR